MSDHTIIAEHKVESVEFVRVEHGVTHVTLGLHSCHPRAAAAEHLLTPVEAIDLADELTRRAVLISAGDTP